MLAEVLIVIPESDPGSGPTTAKLAIPSSEGDDEIIQVGHLEISNDQYPIGRIRIYLTNAFRDELALDSSIGDEAAGAEEDFIAEAVLVELPQLTSSPLSDRITFRIITPEGSREVTIPSDSK
jgi:hypothetical protein